MMDQVSVPGRGARRVGVWVRGVVVLVGLWGLLSLVCGCGPGGGGAGPSAEGRGGHEGHDHGEGEHGEGGEHEGHEPGAGGDRGEHEGSGGGARGAREGQDHGEGEHGEGGEREGHDQGAEGAHGGDEHDRGAGEDHGEHEGPEHGGGGEEGVVRLSQAAMERVGVRVAPAAGGVLEGVVEVPAEVHLNPDRVAHISPLVDGQLLSVGVAIGDRVKAGQVLASLRSVALGQARAELSRATALRDVARQHHERQVRLRAEGINSERSLLEAKLAFEAANAEREAAGSRLRVFGIHGGGGPDMSLVSPIDGVILERHATRGENVSPEDVIFVVADLSRVWVIGRAYEQQIGQIAQPMSASLSLNAYPGRSWAGSVDFVGSSLDEVTRTLPLRVELDNGDGLLRPGLFGSLRLSSPSVGGGAVVLPALAVQTMDGRSVVFVLGGGAGEFVARPVKLGRSGGDQVEVVEGLKPGVEVVVEGAFVLKSELMRGQLGHGHAH